jgi:hypothetical protein
LELAVAPIDTGRNEKVVGYEETTCTWYASVRQPSNPTDRGLRGIDQPRPWRIVWTAGTIREADVGECKECDQHRNFRGERLIIMSSEGITRRGFVEAVGVSAGAASVLGAPAIGRAASANGKIRLGIIGAGSRGGQLLDSFLPQADVELIAIADVDDRHAGETAERVKKAKGNTPDTARDYRPMLDRQVARPANQ